MSKRGISSEPIYYGWEKLVPKHRFLKIYSIIISVILLLVIVCGVLLFIFRPLTPAEIIEKNTSAVVAIQTHYYDESGMLLIGTGSGFIVDGAGYIVTNDHVIDEDGSISVYLKDGIGGKKEYNARIVGSNAYYDVAVLKIFAEDEDYRFPTVELGRAENLTVGEQVVAIGTPQELAYAWTSTVGHVSSGIRNFLDNGSIESKPYIQFDAAVNGGNSGGPLFDSRGKVVGIVEKKVSNNEGMGLAIPIESVIDLINSFIKDDREKPQLGIVGVSVEEGVEYFKQGDRIYEIIEEENESGFLIRYIVKDFRIVEFTDEIAKDGYVFVAESTGFKVWTINPSSGAYGVISEGDIIVGFDGVRLTYDQDSSPYDKIIAMLATKKAGDVVKLEFSRDGEMMTEEIRLTPKN